jgi:hypothetical protein
MTSCAIFRKWAQDKLGEGVIVNREADMNDLNLTDLDLALESLNETDGSLLSQMTDVSEYRPAAPATDEEPNYRFELVG